MIDDKVTDFDELTVEKKSVKLYVRIQNATTTNILK